MPEPIVILSTCGEISIAQKIAKTLVEQRLAACVNIIDKVTSVYRWKDKVENDNEVLLIIKTVKDRVEEIHLKLAEISGYDLPELIVLEIAGRSAMYLEWLEMESGG